MSILPTLVIFTALEELNNYFASTTDHTHRMGNTAEVWWGPACSEHTLVQPLY